MFEIRISNETNKDAESWAIVEAEADIDEDRFLFCEEVVRWLRS
jgi:hypothetical protein